MSTAISNSPVRWDLSALFSSFTDPKIESTWAKLALQADEFESKYRGKINSPHLTADLLASSLLDAEKMMNEASKPMEFAQLVFSTNTGDPAAGAFLSKQMEYASSLSVKTLFFELELQAIPSSIIEPLLSDPLLHNFTHYIHHARAFSPFRLNEDQETILEEVANTGSRAWERLFEEVTSNHVFHYKDPLSGEILPMSEHEVLAKLKDADRAIRAAGADALSEGLEKLERVLVFTYNNLLQDKAVDDRLRKFAYPEQARHLSNELEPGTVETVIRLCRENYPLVSRFYKVKRDILGLEILTHLDRYAPLFEAEGTISYNEARETILEAFSSMNPVLSEKASEFFEKSWIDASPNPGRRGGAFCMYNTPDTHPVVFMTYLEKPDDVMTLAHELGHGVHASLSREQSLFNFSGTLPLAELASTFGEMLTFEKIVEKASLKDKLAMYAAKIESVFATIFRQAAMYQFEKRCHAARRESGELTAVQFGDIWHEELQAMFGDSLSLGEQHRRWWSYVGHFISSPFYVYAYSFGELLALSLYKMAKDGGPEFSDRYIELLKKGGSESPKELMAFVGVDMNSESFWTQGFNELESLMSTFEKLWGEYSKSHNS